MSLHIVLYSHGFGVRRDDRGLFTDISTELSDSDHIMFDYNSFDDSSRTLIVTPLDKQAEILRAQYKKVKAEHPEATIDLICHSQGCVVAALAKLPDVRKTIFLAPPSRFLGAEAKIKQMSERAGTIVDGNTVSYPRRDGSTTIIKPDYWESRDKIDDPISLYNSLAETTELMVINAKQDEVLGETDFSKLSPEVHTVELNANHDFTNQARSELVTTVRGILSDA